MAEIRSEDKIVVPIRGDLPNFFRELFDFVVNITELKRLEPLEEIRALVASGGEKTASDEETITYNFVGRTVFVNKPKGDVSFSGFQNTKGEGK